MFKNLMKIEFWWRQIFEILVIHKPFLGSLGVPQKIWARSVQPFWRLLDTNKQTDTQTDKPNLYIDIYHNQSNKWNKNLLLSFTKILNNCSFKKRWKKIRFDFFLIPWQCRAIQIWSECCHLVPCIKY